MAAAELGLRQFARADFLLRRVEQHLGENGSPYLHLNARALRARLLLTQRRLDEATSLTSEEFDDFPRNAMYGEYRATHALALAALGCREQAMEVATEAIGFTRAAEVRVLAGAAVAVAAHGTSEAPDKAHGLLELASSVDVWDGVVVSLRAVPALVAELADSPSYRVELSHVLARSNDHGLARVAGLADHGRYRPDGPLTVREKEVIDLLAQGLKTRDIASALYIAETTVKVHVRNIRAKLNARTRAEAVARYTEASARGGLSATASSD
jgi:ATP/maltotriose-dependent transcriptional regulator MalT